jgi:hypothetical protein
MLFVENRRIVMKNKGNFAENALPLYEVTELTQDEALLEISEFREEKTKSGILSGEALDKYYTSLIEDKPH